MGCQSDGTLLAQAEDSLVRVSRRAANQPFITLNRAMAHIHLMQLMHSDHKTLLQGFDSGLNTISHATVPD